MFTVSDHANPATPVPPFFVSPVIRAIVYSLERQNIRFDRVRNSIGVRCQTPHRRSVFSADMNEDTVIWSCAICPLRLRSDVFASTAHAIRTSPHHFTHSSISFFCQCIVRHIDRFQKGYLTSLPFAENACGVIDYIVYPTRREENTQSSRKNQRGHRARSLSVCPFVGWVPQ
jgi:hypothetical protein